MPALSLGKLLAAVVLMAKAPPAPPATLGAPVVAAISPTTRLPGELVNIAGANLGPDTRVAFVSYQYKTRAPGALTTWDARLNMVRVGVPNVPAGKWFVDIINRAGVVRASQPLVVSKGPKPLRPEGRQALGARLATMLKRHGDTGFIPADVARKLARDAGAGTFGSVQEALEAEEAAAIADAEKTTGPIARDLVLLAYKTGQPIKKVATDWRHCHAPPPGEKSVAGEGLVLELDRSCSAPRSMPHAHLVVKMGTSDRDTFLAAERGKKPPGIAAHLHTILRFGEGQFYSPPSSSDEWYDGLALVADMLRWLDEHGPKVRPGLALALPVTATVIACTTYQASCPMALAPATQAALKEAALALVAEGLVSPAPVSKESALRALEELKAAPGYGTQTP